MKKKKEQETLPGTLLTLQLKIMKRKEAATRPESKDGFASSLHIGSFESREEKRYLKRKSTPNLICIKKTMIMAFLKNIKPGL